MPLAPNLVIPAESDFDDVPPEFRRRVYRVPYVQLDDSSGGRLWVTRQGWPLVSHLDPANWFLDEQYRERGQRLSGGSGAVYRVPTSGNVARGIDLVVKFSRMGQDVPLQVSSQFPHDVPRHVIDSAVFNDPLQEFGVLDALRSSRFGPPELRILTKRPWRSIRPERRCPPGNWDGRKADSAGISTCWPRINADCLRKARSSTPSNADTSACTTGFVASTRKRFVSGKCSQETISPT